MLGPILSCVSQPIDLADPAFEPTDAQLTELATRAFSGVTAAHVAAMATLRAEIADARERALRVFQGRVAAAPDGK